MSPIALFALVVGGIGASAGAWIVYVIERFYQRYR